MTTNRHLHINIDSQHLHTRMWTNGTISNSVAI